MKFLILNICLLVVLTTNGQNILRGPFLQSGTQNSIIVKWRSNSTQGFIISYGLNKDSLVVSKAEPAGYDHEVLIEGLLPNTKYYYSLSGPDIQTVSAYFNTLPATGSKQKLQFVAFGDCGTGTPKQKEVLREVKKHFSDERIDGMLLLGDNAYNYGFDREFQSLFFDIYQQDLLNKVVLWPSPGNHDYAGRIWPNDFGEKPDYFNIFALPTKGQSGGLASNSEAYYSFDVGNVHFVSLDSYGQEEGKRMSNLLGKQADWLQKDLQNNKFQWTVVFFHHPPFSKGSHDSDNEQELIDIRKNLVPLFDKYGVDLVLTGHSHNYERSFLLHNFSGDETEFSPNIHALGNSSGKYNETDNSCPYIKSDSGTVYMVAGTSGWVGGTSAGYPHDAMYYSNSVETGAVILEAEGNRFTVKYLSSNGVILDNFVMMKEVNQSNEISIDCGEELFLEKSWVGQAYWNNKLIPENKLKIDSLTTSTLVLISDKQQCLTDTFKIHVNPFPEPVASSNSPIFERDQLNLNSTFSRNGNLIWTGPNNFESSEPNPNLTNINLVNAGTYTLTANYKACMSSSTVSVEIIPLLTSKENNSELLVYPNPFKREFYVDYIPQLSDTYKVELFSLSGRKLYEQDIYLEAKLKSHIPIRPDQDFQDIKAILKISSANVSLSRIVSIY